MARDRKHKLLYLVNNDSGRDVEMMLPVFYFAERFLDCEVIVELTPKLHSIFRHKPDCLVLSNTTGSFLHYHAARAAKEGGIPVFALVSEGNFPTDNGYDYWGYNTAQELYEEYLCAWSQRTLDYLKKAYPQFKDRMMLTGGAGFDRYRIYEFADRHVFLKHYNIPENKYKRIIGYAGWGFGNLSHKQGRKDLIHYFKGDESKLAWTEAQRVALERLLRQSVEANPDTLYILKKHPTENVAGAGDPEHNEMAALRDYPNVLYLLDDHIHDLISVADLWWVYESTTALEATMMDKQTLFIVPDPDFPRVGIHEGFPEASNHEEIEAMSTQFFKEGCLPGFNDEKMRARRGKIIEDSIGYDDGYNHIRTSYFLMKTLNQTQAKPTGRVSPYYAMVYWIICFLRPICPAWLFAKIPWLGKKSWVLERVNLEGYPALKARYHPYLSQFYEDENIEERFRDGTLFAQILKSDSARNSRDMSPIA